MAGGSVVPPPSPYFERSGVVTGLGRDLYKIYEFTLAGITGGGLFCALYNRKHTLTWGGLDWVGDNFAFYEAGGYHLRFGMTTLFDEGYLRVTVNTYYFDRLYSLPYEEVPDDGPITLPVTYPFTDCDGWPESITLYPVQTSALDTKRGVGLAGGGSARIGYRVGGIVGGGEPTIEEPPSGPVELVFDASDTWTCPAGVTEVDVECWGAGGGQYRYSVSFGQQAGGGGAYSADTVAVSPGTTYTVTVGAGGGYDTDGGDSWFGSTGTVLAKGGGKAYVIGATRYGGPGGSAAAGVGSVKHSGGSGGSSSFSSGGGGGSAAGLSAAGNSGTSASGGTPGVGGASPDGIGGAGGGGGPLTGTGTAGGVPGGASGGGGRGTDGFTSAGGRVRLTYTVP